MTRVLIVDDQAPNLYMLDVLLKGHGYEVTSASNGAEALKMAHKNLPDLIITDILMPVMDGFALCRQWRAEESLKDIPFIFYTATYTEPKDEQFALGLGADRYIIKPAEPQVLAQAVSEVLAEYREKKLVSAEPVLGAEMEFLRQHNEALFHKLEHKMAKLERANQELEREIAERKQAELALRESERFLDSIVENIPDMIFVKDAKDLRFVRLNKAGEALLGCSSDEIRGLSDDDFFPADEADGFTRMDREALSKNHLVDIPEETIQTRHRGMRVLHTKKIPILGEEGTPRYLLGISEDITELQQMRQNFERARRFETIGMVTAGVAHEVRNPLNALQIMAAVLEKKQGDDPDVRQCILHIREQVNRLSLLMNDLLELGRPVEPEGFTTCNLALILQEVVNQLSAAHEGARARIFVESPEGPANVLGAPSRLMQVFANLLQNALSLSEESTEVKVEVIVEGNTAAVRVRDRGPGIPPDLFPKLFQPFQSKRKGGTGLGLAIVQKIVVDHGGTVEAANNDPGPGACFTVRLPLAG